MTPLYLCASNVNAIAASSSSSTSTATSIVADASTSPLSSAHISDSTTRRPSNVIMHPTQPPKPKKKKTHSTDPYLRDFTLVAEAARRAQMSIMMRDMEDVSISP
ncbi:hypothetical protein GQX73_g1051 [Xylaria multiplex]|uniref:Uncharacterized protein n=1 Tax=Xylaria multiplex TaxID=323545 RepID=A0A7C8IWW0_9PEZI|nr:hypothetical protein GQX73_g1051 [Xylaria multiplex]